MTGAATLSPVIVTGSASAWVRGQVSGPRRTARVVHAGPDAVYVDLDGACLAVLSAGAVRVPCGVRTSLHRLPAVSPGAAASVQGGRLSVPGCDVEVTHLADTTVPSLDAPAVSWGAEHLARLVGHRVSGAVAQLPAEALTALAAGEPGSVMALLGLGPGLTPLGDDVLAGWLASAGAARHPGLVGVRDVVALRAPERTTLLSATLLGCAARGEAVPEVRSLLGGMAARSPEAVTRCLSGLLAIGHDSGQGLLLGVLLAVQSMRAER